MRDPLKGKLGTVIIWHWVIIAILVTHLWYKVMKFTGWFNWPGLFFVVLIVFAVWSWQMILFFALWFLAGGFKKKEDKSYYS